LEKNVITIEKLNALNKGTLQLLDELSM